MLDVVTRFGTLHLRRQVLSRKDGSHLIPANAFLPSHEGILITRGVQEWACLLPQELPFASVARLLGWQAQEESLLSDTTVRNLVRQHGQIIRQAEIEQARALLERPDLESLQASLVVAPPRRPRFGWKAEMTEAVSQALEREDSQPPKGVISADWQRVLHARRQEAEMPLETLRRLGPQVQEGEVVAFVDEVLTRKTTPRQFWQLRTAKIITPDGCRYISGTSDNFLMILSIFLRICVVPGHSLLVVADGARWIRLWFAGLLSCLPQSQLRLDWYHLCKKSRELSCMFCHGRAAKKALLGPLFRHLWKGDVSSAITLLEDYRPQARNAAELEELILSLKERERFIPNYGQCRRELQYIGSGQVEKANDLLVAQRQKGQAIHWSLETSDALTALKTLILNGGWELYWRNREVLSLMNA
jgi:hypothetical protein